MAVLHTEWIGLENLHSKERFSYLVGDGMNHVSLLRQDIEKIKSVLDEFDVNTPIKVMVDESSGIGYTVDIEFEYELNGRIVNLRVSINGVENW